MNGNFCASNYNTHLSNHSEINHIADYQWNLELSSSLSPTSKELRYALGITFSRSYSSRTKTSFHHLQGTLTQIDVH